MTYINCLPGNVIDDPSIGCLDICPDVYPKYFIKITDAWGKTWYLRTIGRDRYEWTRSKSFARLITMKTAKKHAERIKSIWMMLLEDDN